MLRSNFYMSLWGPMSMARAISQMDSCLHFHMKSIRPSKKKKKDVSRPRLLHLLAPPLFFLFFFYFYEQRF